MVVKRVDLNPGDSELIKLWNTDLWLYNVIHLKFV